MMEMYLALNHSAQPRVAPQFDPALGRDVLEGLRGSQKFLPSKWFYDDAGSRLFQQIMALPEYYLTRAEQGILLNKSDDLLKLIAPDGLAVDMIELGSGDGAKTISLCEAMLRHGVESVYYPIDVSDHALAELEARFRTELPEQRLRPILGDYFEKWPSTPPSHRQAVMLFGSNLGNLDREQSIQLLSRIRTRLLVGDVMLLGLDLKKDPAKILSAYNDAQGVTAAFNLNLLRRLNRELDMDFDLEQFSHYATYSPLDGAARSFLVSKRRQLVRSKALNCEFSFARGEAIYTEQSQKYSLEAIEELATASGFELASTVTDDLGWYTIALLRARGKPMPREARAALALPVGWPAVTPW
jgi:dimethylhistidine N-methyltransferase